MMSRVAFLDRGLGLDCFIAVVVDIQGLSVGAFLGWVVHPVHDGGRAD